MKLIFAQGNPTKQYERTRHNVGFMVLDAIAASNGASWQASSKFKADITEVQLQGQKCLLVKPGSYYNETGSVARAVIDFYKLNPAEDILVIHDDLALPFGTIRVRNSGSDAGNNGIKSLNAHLGPAYTRIRVGIWNELRDQVDDANFVLSAFTKDEIANLEPLIDTTIIPLVEIFTAGTLDPASFSPLK
jgi:PTH1 family peptidyl-tRNA hydrolase